jgi:hypothetical protein
MSALSHRSYQAVLSVVIAALAMVALPAAADARPDVHGVPAAPVNAPGTDVAARDQQVQRAVVNARGTDVAARDQQVQRSVVNARGTDVAASDQQAPRIVIRPHGTGLGLRGQVNGTAPVSPAPKADATGPIDGTDDSSPTITLLALIGLALGLAGVGFASWLAVSRKRGRVTV